MKSSEKELAAARIRGRAISRLVEENRQRFNALLNEERQHSRAWQALKGGGERSDGPAIQSPIMSVVRSQLPQLTREEIRQARREQLIEMAEAGIPLREQAEAIALSMATIVAERRVLGLTCRTRQEARWHRVLELRAQDVPVAEQARRLGVSAATVFKDLRDLGLNRGARGGGRPLPAQTHEAIRATKGQGRSARAVARAFGVDSKTVLAHWRKAEDQEAKSLRPPSDLWPTAPRTRAEAPPGARSPQTIPNRARA